METNPSPMRETLKPCRCGGDSYHQVVPAHTHHFAKHMPDAKDSEFVACYQCTAMTSSVDDWNRIMGDETRAEPQAADVVKMAEHDLAYSKGFMAGWNAGVSEDNESLSAVNNTFHAAKAEIAKHPTPRAAEADVVERVASAIDPKAFIGTEQEIHVHCSPYRVDAVQDEIRERAKAAIPAMPPQVQVQIVSDAYKEGFLDCVNSMDKTRHGFRAAWHLSETKKKISIQSQQPLDNYENSTSWDVTEAIMLTERYWDQLSQDIQNILKFAKSAIAATPCIKTDNTQALYNALERIKELESALNPRRWTREQSDAWHKQLPDTFSAFAAIRSLIAKEGA